MPLSNDPSGKKPTIGEKENAARRVKEKSIRSSKRAAGGGSSAGGKDSAQTPVEGLDPRQAIDDWLRFAKEENFPLVTGKRHFDSDLERINTIIEEEISLFRFCQLQGFDVLSRVSTRGKGAPTREGNEHRVFFPLEGEAPRVIKATKPGKYGRNEHTPFLYLERLELSNFLFSGLEMRLEDCVLADGSDYSIISSMQAFSGPVPTLGEVDVYLRSLGFMAFRGQSVTLDYTNSEAGFHLRDCHPGNWVKSADGLLIPIDIIPEIIV